MKRKLISTQSNELLTYFNKLGKNKAQVSKSKGKKATKNSSNIIQFRRNI